MRPALGKAFSAFARRSAEEFGRSQELAELALLNQGVTFSVFSDQRGTEKIFPFCLVPRPISAADWATLERGLIQRIRALSLFLDDVYGEQVILAEGRIPRELVLASRHYLSQLRGVRPPGGVRVHISGIDLIRDPAGTFRVLEDNLRTPSGVSYVLENRLVSKRVMPRAVDAARVQRVDHYPARLADTLRSVAPADVRRQLEQGQVSLPILLNAQQAYLQTSLARVQAEAARLADIVALFQALGGGWWNRWEATIMPPD